jgi:hypothetical protein
MAGAVLSQCRPRFCGRSTRQFDFPLIHQFAAFPMSYRPTGVPPLCHRVWMTVLLVVSLSFVSCIPPDPKKFATQPLCRYTSVSQVKRSNLPTNVYVFPTLLSDAKGHPKEALTPLQNSKGGISDWSAPSAKSRLLRARIEQNLRTAGYRVVPFQDVLHMSRPHSILMVSSYYSAPVALTPGKPEQCVLAMIKANTCDLDLAPGKNRVLANVDGASFFNSEQKVGEVELQIFSVLTSWLGENVRGMVYLKP